MSAKKKTARVSNDPMWFKDAIIYEVHVRAFSDFNGDGIGDFRGLTSKLDYLQQLGITAVWLLPFYPSPLRDDGYDTSDYFNVHSMYGKLSDFKSFLKEAHKRDLKVITELIINHTSDQHKWFQRARKSPAGSSYRNFYVWSDDPEKYNEARIIFKDFEQSNWSWDPIAEQYYWHRFFSHQPDLNFDNPATRKAIIKVMDFWFDLGVDGMRLDAVPYLFERDGTDCENLDETHEFLKELRTHLDQKFPDRMLLAEANQWPEDAAAYFGDGDECHMNYNFPLMPRLFMAMQMEERHPIIDILDQTPEIPDNCQWAIFLRNHDELTLEMVTDEERDYMYRVYAHDKRARINLGIRRRLAPLMKNNHRRIELMNSLLFSLPGTPIVYYGDEIGMGDNIYLGDRDGVRTPMQWSPDRNAGFSKANPQSLYLPTIIDPAFHYESVNVEAQTENSQSLFWWMKRLISLRKRFKAFSRGSIRFLTPDNSKIVAYVRVWEGEIILVIANLSRFAQYAQLDLSDYDGYSPVELFGRADFPAITFEPYLITLGAHSFYWFALELDNKEIHGVGESLPSVKVKNDWRELLNEKFQTAATEIVGSYLQTCRWFASKSKTIREITIADSFPVVISGVDYSINILKVSYKSGEPEFYMLPLGFLSGDAAAIQFENLRHSIVANVLIKSDESTSGLLYDPIYNHDFAQWLLKLSAGSRKISNGVDTIRGYRSSVFRKHYNKSPDHNVKYIGSEQSNSSIIFDDSLILKIFRRLDSGVNPDLELGTHLASSEAEESTPAVLGHIELNQSGNSPVTLGILHEYIPHDTDGWELTLDSLDRYFERVLSLSHDWRYVSVSKTTRNEQIEDIYGVIGNYMEFARQIGSLTAEVHAALSDSSEDENFSAEKFTPFYHRSLFQSMRNTTGQALNLLKSAKNKLNDIDKISAEEVIGERDRILKIFRLPMERKISTLRIRTHGDYHLGQLLFTGKEFFVVDFEGEPARTIEDRRLKRSPLRDVSGMLRSFHYAAQTASTNRYRRNSLTQSETEVLKNWTEIWYSVISSEFQTAYLSHPVIEGLLESVSKSDMEIMLVVYQLEKALYELMYELNNRPEWINIPLNGIIDILQNQDLF